MTRIEDVTDIDSSSATVWHVLTDLSYLPKLYSNVITVEMHPPGPAAIGQRVTILGKVGPMKIEIFIEFTRVDTQACLVSRAVPGGVFKSFEQTIVLTPVVFRTTAKIRFDYELSPAYEAKVPDVALLERLAGDNLRAYSRNLKEICELMPLSE
jgi:Polyketide cyclase / dehydrase and lipid transport